MQRPLDLRDCFNDMCLTRTKVAERQPQYETSTQPGARQKYGALCIHAREKRLVERVQVACRYPLGNCAEADETEGHGRSEFELRMRLHGVGERASQANVLPDLRLHAFNTHVIQYEPQLQPPEAATERDATIHQVQFRVGVRMAQVIRRHRQGLRQVTQAAEIAHTQVELRIPTIVTGHSGDRDRRGA